MWRRWLAFASYLALGVALTLAAVYLTLYLTARIPADGAVTRALAISGTLAVSTVALLGAVFFAVRAAVLLFDKKDRAA
jgi:hypothetical protein